MDRHFGAAARAIEADRARANPAPAAATLPFRVAVSSSDPKREKAQFDELFAAFREALSLSGESTERLSRDAFQQFLVKKTEQLRGKKGSGDIEFVVSIEKGKACLKARLKS